MLAPCLRIFVFLGVVAWAAGSGAETNPSLSRLDQYHLDQIRSTEPDFARIRAAAEAFQRSSVTSEILPMLEAEPSNPNLLAVRILLMAQTAPSQASALLQELETLDQTGNLTPKVRWHLAVSASNWAEVLAISIEQMAKAGPDGRDFWWGEAFAAAGKIPCEASLNVLSEKALILEIKNPAALEMAAKQMAGSGRTDDAIALLTHLHDSAAPGQRPRVLQSIAKIHWEAGKTQQALATIFQAIDLTAPNSALRESFYRQLESMAANCEAPESIESLLENRSKDDPSDLQAWITLARLRALSGGRQARVEVLAKAHELHSAPSLGVEELISAYDANAQPDRALELLQKLRDPSLSRSQDPREPMLGLREASLLLRLDREEEAVNLVQDLEQGFPAQSPKHSTILQFARENRLAVPLEQGLQRSLPHPSSALELIGFYLQQQNMERARQSVDVMLESLSGEDNREDFAIQAARLFLQTNAPELSLEIANSILKDNPSATNAALFKVNWLAENDPALAAEWLNEFIRTQPRESEIPESLDRRLFELLQVMDRCQPGSTPEDSLALRTIIPPRSPDGGPNVASQLALLKGNAEKTPAEFMRLARWQGWSGDSAGAESTIMEALEIYPEKLEIFEASVETAIAVGRNEKATQRLLQLAAKIPQRRGEILTRAAFLEIDHGRSENALQILRELALEQPDNPEAWKNLATAQWQTDAVFDSLDSWLKAYRLSSEQEKPAALRSIAAIHERLQQPHKALILYRQTLEESVDSKVMTSLQQDALEFSKRHGLESEWQKLHADLASAHVPKGEGITFPSQPRSIRTADRESEKNPVLALEREIALHPEIREPWIERARVLENSGQLTEAAEAWQEAVERFPRQTAILREAASFFQRQDLMQAAVSLWRRISQLEPLSPTDSLTFAQQLIELGERVEALDILADALARSPDRGEITTYPDPMQGMNGQQRSAIRLVYRLRATSGSWSSNRAAILSSLSSTATPAPAVRESLIESISEIVRQTEAAEIWKEKWQSLPSHEESVRGLVALGATHDALTRLEEILAESPSDYRAALSFFGIAAMNNEWQRALDLLRQAGEEFPERLDIFLASLSQSASHPPVSGSRSLMPLQQPQFDGLALLQAMQADDSITATLRWPAAQVLAGNQRWELASQLGWLAVQNMAGKLQAHAVVEVCDWAIRSGDMMVAKNAAALAKDRTDGSFDDPALAALRVWWTLSSPSEKEALLSALQASLQQDGNHVPALISLALIEALDGNPVGSHELLQTLVAALLIDGKFGNEEDGLGAWALAASHQLQAWNLPAEATGVLELALNADPALLALRRQTDAYERESLRTQLILSSIGSMLPSQAEAFLSAAIVETGTVESAFQLGTMLEQAGHPYAALQCYLAILSRNPGWVPAVTSAYRSAIQAQAADWIPGLVEQIMQSPEEMTGTLPPRKDILLQKAIVEFRQRNLQASQESLDAGLALAPNDPSLLDWRSRLAWWQGEPDLALALREQQIASATPGTGNPNAIPEYISWLLAMGEFSKADETVHSAMQNRPGLVSSIFQAYLPPLMSTDQEEPAIRLALQALPDLRPQALSTLLQACNQAQHTNHTGLLLEQLKKNPSLPPENEQLIWQYLARHHPEMEEKSRLRLQELTSETEGNPQKIWETSLREAREAGALEEFLKQQLDDFRQGNSGNSLWLAISLAHPPSPLLKPFVELLLQKEEEMQQLSSIALHLEARKLHFEAARIQAKMLECFPGNIDLRMQLARNQWKAGERSEAMRTLSPVLRGRTLVPGLSRKLAETFRNIGRLERSAQLYLESAWESRNTERRQDLIQAASLFQQTGDPTKALELFHVALEHPGDTFPTDQLANLLHSFKSQDADALPTILSLLPGWAWEEVMVEWCHLKIMDHDFDGALVMMMQHPELALVGKGGTWLAQATMATGRYAEAISIWEKALEIHSLPETRSQAGDLAKAWAATLEKGSPSRRNALEKAWSFDPTQLTTLAALAATMADGQENNDFVASALEQMLFYPLPPKDREQALRWLASLKAQAPEQPAFEPE